MEGERHVAVISLEGNIGVGKSTQLRLLRERYREDRRVVCVDEPVREWQERGFLRRVYNEEEVTLAFQMMAMTSLGSELSKAHGDGNGNTGLVIITERSLEGNRRVFAEANLHGEDNVMYEYTFDAISSMLPVCHQRYVYLKAASDELTKRIESRGRDEEAAIPLEYIELLNKLHNDWLCDPVGDDVAGVTVVDASSCRSEDEIHCELAALIDAELARFG